MDLAVIVFHVAVMVCGRHSRSPFKARAENALMSKEVKLIAAVNVTLVV